MNDDITTAQVKAGEDAVVERLRQKGLLPADEDSSRRYPDPSGIFEAMEQRHQRHSLEHSLATTFVALQREKNPARRTRMWSECLRLAAELEKLNNGTTTTTTT